MHRVQQDWCQLVDEIIANASKAGVESARKKLAESIVSIAPIFAEKPFFMSDDFTLVDCCVAPILWRLPALGIDIDQRADKHLKGYMTRLFERESFELSLSELEREMRD
jgi:RNA polymerase-associated protein